MLSEDRYRMDVNYELLDRIMSRRKNIFFILHEDGDDDGLFLKDVAGYDKIYFSEEPDYEKTKSYSPIMMVMVN